MKHKVPKLRPSQPRRNASILSTGAYLPSRVLTNADLEKMVDTTDEWIIERTGIKERRLAAPDEYTSHMGTKAAQQALTSAGLKPTDIDLIIVATCTPDTIFPSTACHIQHQLGATRAAAFDVQAACSGFLYGMIVAEQFIASHMYETVLVIGAEKLSSIVNWKDRNTCVLFGDGAGAVVMQNRANGHGILASDLGSDGSKTDILSLPAGGCRLPMNQHILENNLHCLQMSGKEVFKVAVNGMIQSSERCLYQAGLTSSELNCVIPHQANLRIITAIAQRLELPLDQFYINLDKYGNMSAACIPVALHEASQSGRIKKGDHLLLVAFGGGLTWASAILEW
jgi:3-oxoacyl-[acyl-carrier-protein] synthase III